MRFLLALAAGFTIAALAVPLLASSAPNRSSDATALQQRVAKLERTTTSLKKQLAAQTKINTAQNDRLTKLESQVANPPMPKLTVSSAAGTDVSIGAQSFGSANAVCPTGTTLVAGAYKADDQVEVSSSAPGTSANTWNFSIWNPNRATGQEQTSVTPYAICLSLTP